MNVNYVRNIEGIKELWEKGVETKQVLVRGRPSGLSNNQKNPIRGSHITFINTQEAVSIFQSGKEEFTIMEFKIAQDTELGKQIIKIVRNKGFKITFFKS